MLKKLPVIYVLENNQWSVCSHVSARQADENIFHRASQDLLLAKKIDGNNVITVYEAALQAMKHARQGLGPSFIECETYRILGHAGCKTQDPKGYRDQKEVEAWGKKCPVKSFQKTLLQENILTHNDLTVMEKRIETEIDDAFTFAKKSPLSTSEDLYVNLFCE